MDGERKPTTAIKLEGEEYRRSVYIQVRRTRTLSLFETFDAPTLSPNCDKRSESTSTPQSLLMMNSDFSLQMSSAFAARVLKEADTQPAQIERAWQLAFGTDPTAADVAEASEFLAALGQDLQIENSDEKRQEAFSVFCITTSTVK